MNTTWVLRTEGNPRAAVVRFLNGLWDRQRVQGMVAPVPEGAQEGVSPVLLTERERLTRTDVFSPVMRRNTVKDLESLPGAKTQRLAAVLRPCEVRALDRVARRGALDRARLLVIGFDCLATFSEQDYEERSRGEGGAEGMIREALRFARQGGILAYRYRRACQACPQPAPNGADLALGFLGVPVRKSILVIARDADTAARSGLNEITDGPASDTLVEERQETLEALALRRKRTAEKMIRSLSEGIPSDIEELIAFFAECEPCRECLEACAVYDGELQTVGEKDYALPATVSRWLASCVGCGMCEQACPRGLPLAAMHDRIARALAAQGLVQ